MLDVSVEGLVEELMSCSDADLDDRVRSLELQRRRVEAELALTAGEIDRRRSYLAVHCDHLGCNLPAEACEVDHSTEWHAGGRTDRDNAGAECGSHNRAEHRQRWRTRRDTHGRIHTIRADGTIMLPVGVRPPVFPDEPASSRILHAATLDGWDPDTITRRRRTH